MDIVKNHSPFFLILFKPAEAFRLIFSTGKYHIAFLFVLGSLAQVTQKFWAVSDGIIYFSSVLGSGLIALLIGWAGYYFFGMIIHFWSGIFDGKGSLRSTLVVLAWSFVPSIIGLALYIICYASFGEQFFQNNTPVNIIGFQKTLIFCLRVILGLWSFYILLRGLMVINDFSLIKTLVTLLPLLILSSILPFLLVIL